MKFWRHINQIGGAAIPGRQSAKPNHAVLIQPSAEGRQECLPQLLLVFALLLGALQTHADAADWPHPRGGLQGQGVANTQLADAYEPAWTFKTKAAVLSSAVIKDGVVYVGSEDKHLYAIDAKTGKEKWKLPVATVIDASPIVQDGSVYIGTDGGVMHAVDAATGKERWQFATEGRISGEAAVVTLDPENENTEPTTVVLFGSHDGLLYCLDAGTGTQRWAYETGDYINCGITLDGGTIVLAGCDSFLHLIDLKTGKSLGEVELGGEVAGTPALKQGKAYLGHMQSEVLAIDTQAKGVVWKFHDRDFPFVGSPALSGDTLLIGSRGRRVYSINTTTGEKNWHIRTRGGVEGSPVIAGDRAVFGSAGGVLSIIDLKDGATVWQYNIGATSVSPALTDTLLVVGSDDGNVYAFKPIKKADND